jgi:uncharacterized integral membrane protein
LESIKISWSALILGILVFSLISIPLLTFYYSFSNLVPFPAYKIGAISVFMGICLVGIIIAVFPHKYRQLFHHSSHKPIESSTIDEATTLRVKGHHPLCGMFTAHNFHLGNHIFCAGCMGLVTGAIIALSGCSGYILVNKTLIDSAVYMFWIGFTAICVGILPSYGLALNFSLSRIIVNAFFVIGWFFLLVAVIELQQNIILEAYVLAILIFSVAIRITGSKQHHSQICKDCDLKLCHD